ncbi:uncharacterized protein PHALS_15011 [Plasmopara halstedii]|uniref:Uncharacterized protein n=1 Tax=Plasmopara halstedii TaxID=4781 RepID=A0A0P1AUM3_PLAHL|nr:uncharacterized protein PHALS_15011 [Plasmopara halstedii]CEG44271.1 hypothetical protein PHALS_15011 [Plasmopara halstedii]|eukprot:XP_024580640.1 hypothetical protein PHALS_15011 [Plasmopara halstedii]
MVFTCAEPSEMIFEADATRFFYTAQNFRCLLSLQENHHKNMLMVSLAAYTYVVTQYSMSQTGYIPNASFFIFNQSNSRFSVPYTFGHRQT